MTRLLHALAKRGKAGAAVALRADLWRSGVRGGGDVVEIPGRHELYRELWSRTGADVEDLGDGFLALSRDGRRVVVCDNQVPLDDPVTLRVAAHKPLSARLLGQAGLSVAEHVSCTIDDLGPARGLLAGGPCVVKPAFGSGAGNGVTCGVESGEELVRAAVRAARWGRELVVERQVAGDEYRVLVLDGRVAASLRRRPPRVVGDGRSSVAELVARENERRVAARGRAGLWALALDLDALLALARQGLGPRSTPAEGREVEIGVTANENGPADNDEVDPPVPAARAAVTAAGVLGLRLAAVELRGDVIVEVNGTPGWHYHEHIASSILESLLQEHRP